MSTVKKRASVCTDHQRNSRPAIITAMPAATKRGSRAASWPSSRTASQIASARLAKMTTMRRSSVPRSRDLLASPERRRPIHNWLIAQTRQSATKAWASVMGCPAIASRVSAP
jgi:hypothetical protein